MVEELMNLVAGALFIIGLVVFLVDVFVGYVE